MTTYTNAGGYYSFPQYTGSSDATAVVPVVPSSLSSQWSTAGEISYYYYPQPQLFNDSVFYPVAQETYVPTSVAITPTDSPDYSNVATVGTGQDETFVATELDQYGNPMATQPTFTWSSPGTVDSSTGVFTAASPTGTSSVTATDSATGLAGTIGIAEVAPVVAQAASAVNQSSTTVALSALGSDPSDNIDPGTSTLTYTWSVTSAPSGATTSFSDNGDNSA